MTPEIRSKIGASRRGPSHPLFKGEWLARSGYGQVRAFVWIDKDTQASLGLKRPYTPRARLVWLRNHPGETLRPGDVIHHTNGDALDDRPENLERIASQGEHALIHNQVGEINAGRIRLPDAPCEICDAPVRPWRRFCSRACFRIGISGPGNANHGRPGQAPSVEARERMRQSQLARWARVKAARI